MKIFSVVYGYKNIGMFLIVTTVVVTLLADCLYFNYK